MVKKKKDKEEVVDFLTVLLLAKWHWSWLCVFLHKIHTNGISEWASFLAVLLWRQVWLSMLFRSLSYSTEVLRFSQAFSDDVWKCSVIFFYVLTLYTLSFHRCSQGDTTILIIIYLSLLTGYITQAFKVSVIKLLLKFLAWSKCLI